MSSSPTPSQAPPNGSDFKTWAVYLIRELGLTSCLVGFVCYLLAVQLPAMRDDFRQQTDKLSETVANNSRAMADHNRVMADLTAEIRALRFERKNP